MGNKWRESREIIRGFLTAGNYNATITNDERKGGATRNPIGSKAFRSFIAHAGLLDLGYTGPKYTWKRGNLLVRLDRALCNQQWLESHPNTEVMHLPMIQSDHRPILIQLKGEQQVTKPPFRFFAPWISHPNFKDLVTLTWTEGRSLVENIEHFTLAVQDWNHNTFGIIGRNKRTLHRRINGVQKALERNPFNSYLLEIERALLDDYENVCMQEEILWLQKSRSQWICDGDRNTHYYHTKALIRRRQNRISMLKDNDGRWVSDQHQLKSMATNYFKQLYTLEDGQFVPYPCSGQFPPLTDSLSILLDGPISKEETKKVLFDMAPLKSPGVDGLHAIFFQS
ncbi:uncharacterized protein LOC114741006 [Neltuma alba]|uniref:uncharacterized protein LOC114741006 n=1 Tax=Neltuma alba TaxID=207710 RepID=UPI0010A3911B|nr:uncharacterized protein LOC114741006 [Prosopis alba]